MPGVPARQDNLVVEPCGSAAADVREAVRCVAQEQGDRPRSDAAQVSIALDVANSLLELCYL